MTAAIFDEAGIPVLLVGDSAGNNFLGEENTIPVTVEELIPLTRAVVRASQRAMVVADLPFGSYESSPEQALATSTRFFKEAGAMAVKIEGAHIATVEKLTNSGIPVMGHLGLTPQSLHQLSGYRVQGRTDGEVMLAAAPCLTGRFQKMNWRNYMLWPQTQSAGKTRSCLQRTHTAFHGERRT
jgi:3-methyl-2-oxobutanoate hydroxymethyltransferase